MRIFQSATRLLLASLAILWALNVSTVDAQAPGGPRTVEGRVANGSEGGAAVSGLKVVFHVEGAGRHGHLAATTDDEGRFRFDGIAFEPEITYGVSVTYQGALYGSDLDLSDGPPPPVELTIYEAVQDDAILTVSRASLLFGQVDKESQTLWALEIVAIRNETDRAYVPGPEPMDLLRFGLPPGAEGLMVDTSLMEPTVLQVDLGFGLSASVPPGEHELMYAYRFPYSGEEALFSRSLRYGADSLRVLAPREVAGLSSGRLGPVEEVVIGGRDYYLLTGSDLPRGETVSLSLTGLPKASFGDRVRDRLEDVPWEYAVPTALAVLMANLIGLALWKKGFADRAGPATESVEAEHDDIVLEIAGLDRSFQEGAIAGGKYRRRRRALVARLAAASRRRLAER